MTVTMRPRQVDELHRAVRHVGRAMAAMSRAGIPSPPRTTCPDWLCALYDAERAVAETSNRLIDALEAMAVLE